MSLLKKIKPFHMAFALLVGLYGLSCARQPGLGGLVGGTNFLFHEAGHFFFRPFGQFIGTLGGTIGQLIFPVGCTLYFTYQKQYYSAAVVMMWVAHNLFGISVYAGDAAATRLALPEGTYHDWNWMFTRLGILRYTTEIARLIYFTGLLAMLASIAGMVRCSLTDDDGPMPEGEEWDKSRFNNRFTPRF